MENKTEETAVVEQPTAQEELAKLKEALTAKEAESLKWQEEAKKHQSNFTKEQQRNREGLQSKMDKLEDKISVLTDYIASQEEVAATPRDEGDEETPSPKAKPRASLDTLRQQREYQRLVEVGTRADKMAKDAGLDMDVSPELIKAQNLILKRRYDEGIAEVERVISEKKQASSVSQQEQKKPELTDEEKEELARQYLEKKGALKTDTGTPSAPTRDWNTILDDYASGKIKTEEFSLEAKKRGKTF